MSTRQLISKFIADLISVQTKEPTDIAVGKSWTSVNTLSLGIATGWIDDRLKAFAVILLSSLPWVSRLIGKTGSKTNRDSYAWLVDLVIS